MNARTPRSDPQWPIRQSVCLDCRSTSVAGGSCHVCGSLRVHSLADPVERELLVTEVWGPPSLRRELRAMAKAGATGGATGGALEGLSSGCSGVDLIDLDILGVLAVIAVVASVFALLRWCIGKLVAGVRRRRDALPPAGALKGPRRLAPATGRVGTVVGRGRLPRAPLSGRRAVAFGVEGTCSTGWRKREVMLRDAATVGFEVMLDSGERVHIPAGAIALEMGGGRVIRPDAAVVASYVGGVDPHRDQFLDDEPLPLEHFVEAVVMPGDRVEVLGSLAVRPDPRGVVTGYREPAPAMFSPSGIPRLRVAS